jgi:hypothetical protein
MPKTLSGAAWVSKFPNSRSVDDLTEPFRAAAKKFISALHTSGATVSINATLRPKERAYLMHWSFCIAQDDLDPEPVPPFPGVDIEWVHRDASGCKQLDASKRAAQEMVDGYGIAYRPVLESRHSQGLAIDMDISWPAPPLNIKDAAGKLVTIKTGKRDGSNPQLQQVGKSYGVIKLPTDPPHWSSDGH